MNAHYTSGPWEIDLGGKGESHRIKTSECPVAHVLPIGDPLEQRSNARLIASAPELLEALENCLYALEHHYVAGEKLSDHYEGRIQRAKEAISKARGQA